MPSAFHGLSTMNTALRAFQRGLDVTGHNISNVNTPGYSRQTLTLTENVPTAFSGVTSFMLGNGVNIASVNRIQDAFLAARKMDITSDGGRLGSLSTGLRSIESLTLEPGGAGINEALDRFFNAWSSLGSNPSEPSLRTQVQQAGSSLANRIRGLYGSMQSQVSNANAEAGETINKIQQLMTSIGELNQDIRVNSIAGATPNDLLDMRDQKLNELSELVNIRVQRLQDGSANVYMGNLTLVDQLGAKQFPTSFDAATGTVSDANGSYPLRSGKLLGLFQVSQRVTVYQQKLDSLANTLRSEFNSIHSTGTNALGATGQNFFNDVTPPATPTGAIDFDLDAAILADPRNIASGVSGAPGDGGLALSMSSLRDSSLPGLSGRTFRQFYADIVGNVADDVAYTKTLLDTQGAIGKQIEEQVQSISGVSLDDEMASMLRFQRSYQAAARALSVFDQTTEDLLNIIR